MKFSIKNTQIKSHLIHEIIFIAIILSDLFKFSKSLPHKRNAAVDDTTSSPDDKANKLNNLKIFSNDNTHYNDKLVDSIQVEESIEKIKVKLYNGQILIGNRKIVYFTLNRTRVYVTKKIIYEFLGIPFAKPPIHDKRFKFPEKMETLFPEDVYDATYHRPSCIQELDTTFPGFKGAETWNAPGNISEDCLYFNIWIPVTHQQDELLYTFETLNNLNNIKNINFNSNGFKLLTNQLKASLIWFYGGSFNSGSANLAIYNGTIMAAFENIIVMTPNYRVGPFGFLYLNRSEAPGNAGLADQILAIEWYKENFLDYFGGQASNICLFGESAGAMSLHYLLLSEKRNLFNRIILQSSSSYSDLTYHSPHDAYQIWLSYAEKVGCLKIDYEYENVNVTVPLKLQIKKKKLDSSVKIENITEAIIKCMVKLDTQTLSWKQFEIEYVNEYLKMQSIPTLDYHGLITIDPIEYSFNRNKYSMSFNHDILAGLNQNEGTYFAFYLYVNVYYDLNGFINTTNYKYDNEFVVQRLTEVMKTSYPNIDYKQILKIKVDENTPQLTILSSDNYNKNITDSINRLFLEKYARCLNNLYTYDDSLVNFNLNSAPGSPERAFRKMSKIAGDYVFNCPTIKFVNEYNQVHHGRSYFYKFNRRSNAVKWPSWFGVSHGFEIDFVFGSPWQEHDAYDDTDRLISRKVMNVWANFAKHGKLYSHFDTIKNRENFIEFSAESHTEEEEFETFNKYYRNCDLFNELNNKRSYAAKYEECVKYQLKLNIPISSFSHSISSKMTPFIFISSWITYMKVNYYLFCGFDDV